MSKNMASVINSKLRYLPIGLLFILNIQSVAYAGLSAKVLGAYLNQVVFNGKDNDTRDWYFTEGGELALASGKKSDKNQRPGFESKVDTRNLMSSIQKYLESPPGVGAFMNESSAGGYKIWINSEMVKNRMRIGALNFAALRWSILWELSGSPPSYKGTTKTPCEKSVTLKNLKRSFGEAVKTTGLGESGCEITVSLGGLDDYLERNWNPDVKPITTVSTSTTGAKCINGNPQGIINKEQQPLVNSNSQKTAQLAQAISSRIINGSDPLPISQNPTGSKQTELHAVLREKNESNSLIHSTSEANLRGILSAGQIQSKNQAKVKTDYNTHPELVYTMLVPQNKISSSKNPVADSGVAGEVVIELPTDLLEKREDWHMSVGWPHGNYVDAPKPMPLGYSARPGEVGRVSTVLQHLNEKFGRGVVERNETVFQNPINLRGAPFKVHFRSEERLNQFIVENPGLSKQWWIKRNGTTIELQAK